ncbi:MAG: hypothetical protein A2X94_01805 [Bdellovibrionales bacterium GWB1_55_8]|nr:MAG: hypothetical protein A2X94_01805 [Bdellovibrionales bacterium GWB1_55_8]
MFSELPKKLTLMTLAISGALMASSCNFHFRESPSPEKAMQLGDSDSGCLTGSFEKISAYLNGRASDQQITTVWNCLSRSLQLFSERTRGAKPGVYTPDELRGFLEKYFLTDFHITDGLLRESMELKCTLLGGSPDVLTLEELQRTRQLVQVLMEQSIALKTFIPLSFGWVLNKDPRTVDEAVSTLEKAAQAIGRPIQKTGYPYYFARFDALRKEVEAVLGRSTSSPVFRSFRDRMPLARALKSILVAPKGDRIDGHEWVNFLTTSARWYGVAVRFWHLTKNYPDWTTGEGRSRFTTIVLDALTLLDEAVLRHPGEVIPFHELDLLIDGLDDSELPFAKNAEENLRHLRPALKKVLKPVIRRALGGALDGRDGREAQGITRAGLKRVAGLVEHWSEGQKYLEALFERARVEFGESKAGYTAEQLSKFTIEDVLPAGDISSVMIDAAEEIRRAIPKSPPFFEGGDKFIFVSTPPRTQRSFYDLSIMNISYAAARILIQGYAARERAQSDTGILLSEFHQVLADVLEMGITIRILDPKRDNEKMFTTRFTEGSLFTYASNGDEYLDLHEAAQLFPMLFSAYLMADTIHKEASAHSCPVRGTDPFGKPVFSTDCYMESYFSNIEDFWKRLPGMLQFYKSLSSADKSDFQEHLMAAARLPGSPKHLINSNDSIGFAGIAQYVDAMFARFDLDASGTLDQNEAKPAFLVFRGALKNVVEAKKMSKIIPDKDLEALFTYILAHSEPPSKITHLPKWYWWKLKTEWKFQTDRMGILRIFGQLMQN